MSRPRVSWARRLAREIDTSWLDERDADDFNDRMIKAIVLGLEADEAFMRWIQTADKLAGGKKP